MKKYFTTLLLLIPLITLAQSNYKPGYIINLNGDTVKGFVDYKDWNQNPKSINFKTGNNTQVDKQNTNNTQAFAVTGFEYYKRFTLAISMAKTNTSDLSTGMDSSSTTSAVFLRLITGGKNVSLYSFTDSLKTRYFIAEGNSVPTELTYRVFINPEDGSKTVTQTIYRRQLQVLIARYQPADKKTANQIQFSDYSESDLQKIVSKINGPNGQSKIKVESQNGLRFYVGLAANGTKTTSQGTAYLNSTSSTVNFFPEVHVGMDAFFNKNVGTVLIRTELSVTANKGNYNLQGAADGLLLAENITFNQKIITLNPQFLYNFYNKPTAKIYLAVGVGFNASFISNEKRNTSYYSLFDGAFVTSNVLTFNNSSSLLIDVTTKAGFTLNNKFDIYVGFSPEGSVNSRNTPLNIAFYKAGINYLFGKK
ncbi:hypothetical protein BDD43_0292 [Mucilaginibacter gracilis]|uniref:Outer membrane protein with beta-barrel domain n=1 Tax=Mucilaginibacter gracilis TaxID=423350 RepID=A0A495ITV2_9SPHI|nr:hypothetical protein [Mucilaginibacter gracilis]RKR80196.1 hypothetical protein BDD43_0292 [Mucilaginibacter gracilis]